MKIEQIQNINYQNLYKPKKISSYFKEFFPDTSVNKKNNLSYIRPFKGTKQEIEAKGTVIIDKWCEAHNIPEELKPKFIVVDNLKYESQEEISARFGLENTELFESTNKLPQNMSNKEFLKYIQEHTPLSKQTIANIIQTEDSQENGSYNSDTNTITYYTSNYRKGIENIEKTLNHELYHFGEAIARSSLKQETRDKLVKLELLLCIDRGERKPVFWRYPQKDNSSPLISIQTLDSITKDNFLVLVNNHLFADDWSMYNKLKNYTTLLEQEMPDKEQLLQAKNDLGDFVKGIEDIAKGNKNFNTLNASKNDMVLALMQYSMSIEFRYQYFRQQELKNIKQNNSKENIEIAKQSVKNHMDSIQSNYALEFIKDKDNAYKIYWQYYTSPEEVNARVKSEEKELQKLHEIKETALKNLDFKNYIKIRKSIERLKREYVLDKAFQNLDKAENDWASNRNLFNYEKYKKAKVLVDSATFKHVREHDNKTKMYSLFFGGTFISEFFMACYIMSKSTKEMAKAHPNIKKCCIYSLEEFLLLSLISSFTTVLKQFKRNAIKQIDRIESNKVQQTSK